MKGKRLGEECRLSEQKLNVHGKLTMNSPSCDAQNSFSEGRDGNSASSGRRQTKKRTSA